MKVNVVKTTDKTKVKEGKFGKYTVSYFSDGTNWMEYIVKDNLFLTAGSTVDGTITEWKAPDGKVLHYFKYSTTPQFITNPDKAPRVERDENVHAKLDRIIELLENTTNDDNPF